MWYSDEEIARKCAKFEQDEITDYVVIVSLLIAIAITSALGMWFVPG